jgi:hypothetical protein
MMTFARATACMLLIPFNLRLLSSRGVTNTGADVQDCFIMQENPSNPLQYSYKGQFVNYTIYDEVRIIHCSPAVPQPSRSLSLR